MDSIMLKLTDWTFTLWRCSNVLRSFFLLCSTATCKYPIRALALLWNSWTSYQWTFHTRRLDFALLTVVAMCNRGEQRRTLQTFSKIYWLFCQCKMSLKSISYIKVTKFCIITSTSLNVSHLILATLWHSALVNITILYLLLPPVENLLLVFPPLDKTC